MTICRFCFHVACLSQNNHDNKHQDLDMGGIKQVHMLVLLVISTYHELVNNLRLLKRSTFGSHYVTGSKA